MVAGTAVSAVRCPICNAPVGTPLFVRERVPASLNRPCPTVESALRQPAGRFEFAFCGDCEFGFNPAFDPSLALYDDEYENDQGCSALFQQHLEVVLERAIALRGSRGGAVVEVGCGQGDFLRRLAQRLDDTTCLLGVDPCCRQVEEPTARVRYRRANLNSLAGCDLPADASLVYSRHVIEHVPNPVEFLREWVFRGLVKRGTPIFLETPSLEWILKTGSFTDFVYEHCCYFSEWSLRRAMHRAGFLVRSVEVVFEGQYFLATAEVANHLNVEPQARLGMAHKVARFAAAEARMRQHWLDRLCVAASRGPLALWGAGAKGVSFATLLDTERRLLNCLIDVNPAKQERFVPLTGHPIRSWESALRCGVTVAVVMNPNYAAEIRADVGDRMDLILLADWNEIHD